jgi:ABC-2 type transport system permease protein
VSAVEPVPGRSALIAGELAKLPAFLRRDVLVALSYRVAFVSDLLGLSTQVLLFYFVGRMVDPETIPSFGGSRATYLEFVAIGIALGVFVQIGLGRVASALRTEQLTGTFEAILATPTAIGTIQLGSVVFDLLYVPIRTGVFLVVMAAAFGLDFDVSGIVPAGIELLAVIPFVWGLGLLSAAAIVTFRRGAGLTGLIGTLLALGAGAYFPLDLLPGWAQALAEVNPIALSLDGMRESLLGGAGWSPIAHDLLRIVPASALSLLLGVLAFRWAFERERRRGSLGLY